jgi:hypothetical protein
LGPFRTRATGAAARGRQDLGSLWELHPQVPPGVLKNSLSGRGIKKLSLEPLRPFPQSWSGAQEGTHLPCRDSMSEYETRGRLPTKRLRQSGLSGTSCSLVKRSGTNIRVHPSWHLGLHVSRKRHADRHGMCRSRTFDLGRAGDLTYMHMRSRSSAESFSGAKTRRCWWTATAASQIHSTAVSTRF